MKMNDNTHTAKILYVIQVSVNVWLCMVSPWEEFTNFCGLGCPGFQVPPEFGTFLRVCLGSFFKGSEILRAQKGAFVDHNGPNINRPDLKLKNFVRRPFFGCPKRLALTP